jgi:superfamily I DNA/RNA helicase
MATNYSSYQIAVFDFIANHSGSAIVDAKAGSGKTTTIVEACRRIPEGKTCLFLAFNKDIVTELSHRLPTGTACATFNAAGYRAWKAHTGRRFMKVEGNKTQQIIRDNFSPENQRKYAAFVKRAVALAKSSGLTVGHSDSDWLIVVNHHGVDLDDDDAELTTALKLAKRTLQASVDMAYDIIDFDDQLYMPWLVGAAFERYDFVFIDEAQDTNTVQKDLLDAMLANDGRLIAVGDPNQAIYGFRGADSDSLPAIARQFNAVTLPLSICYRCSGAVIRAAQAVVPEIEAAPGCAEGSVVALDKYTSDTFTANDAILCRVNAPLVSMAYDFIGRGRGVNFLGRDLGQGLKNLVQKMKARTIEQLLTKLDVWAAKETAKLLAKDKEDQVEAVQDKVACLRIIIDNLTQDSPVVDDVLTAIDALFEEGAGRGVTLSSVHKSKGREWAHVFILDADQYMPSKFARKPWQQQQEKNLIYVAITRAQTNLYYITSNQWSN